MTTAFRGPSLRCTLCTDMPRLPFSHEEVRAKLFHVPTLNEKERHDVAETMFALSERDAWFPDALRRELKRLQSSGGISETDRHAVERLFFPDHGW